MEDKIEKGTAARKFLQETIPQIFAYGMIGSALSGWILETFLIDAQHVWWADGGFFLVGFGGLTFDSIFQFFGLSVALGVLLLVFVSDIFLTKFMKLWRFLIFLTCALVLLSLFVIIFGWLPTGVWQSWAALFITFILFASVSIIPEIIRTRRQDKQLEKALSDYKSKKAEK